ncbi:MAG: TatD family hydrolase [Oscillospiraceae bacterium]|nr:TatD family hydrolase [Oscillospiraceae bacterium]
MFDSHAHYDDEDFDTDRHRVLQSLKEQGVDFVLNAACDVKSCRTTLALTKEYDFVYGSAGIHPHSAAEVLEDESYIELIKQCAANERIVAIGEIGLDYHYDFSPRDAQKAVFIRQMQLARELNMPVIIHSREATADTLEILKMFPEVTGVVHCFSGSDQTALEVLKLGYFVGFTGSVTFKNNKKGPAAAAVVPLDRLLIETDCPYMAPVPLRGKRCDSTMLPHVAQKLAEIKGVTPQEIIDCARKNTLKLFNIK